MTTASVVRSTLASASPSFKTPLLPFPGIGFLLLAAVVKEGGETLQTESVTSPDGRNTSPDRDTNEGVGQALSLSRTSGELVLHHNPNARPTIAAKHASH